MTTWPELEVAVRERPRWRRVGREWKGPCPLTDDGTDTAWVAQGESAEIRIGCRRHGGGLRGEDFREHLRALVGDAPSAGRLHRPPKAPPARTPAPEPKALPGLVWVAAVEATGTPGHLYLATRRGVWPGEVDLPAAVRWLPAGAAAGAGLRPRMPAGAAGCLCYRYAAPGERETRAVHVEAIDADGAAVPFVVGKQGRRHPVKRPGVTGSQLDHGRRTFLARAGAGSACWLVEGPLDAMALVTTGIAGAEDEVRGAWSTSAFQAAAVEDWQGGVVIAPDADAPRDDGEIGAGQRAGLQLLGELRAAGRPCRVELPPSGFDWGDVAEGDLFHRLEREAEYDDERK